MQREQSVIDEVVMRDRGSLFKVSVVVIILINSQTSW